MDKKSLLAMLLIAVILITMPMYQEYILGVKPGEEINERSEESIPKETEKIPELKEEAENIPQQDIPESEIIEQEVKLQNMIGDSTVKNIVLETDNYLLELSSQGGGSLKRFILKNYIKYDSSYVNMISEKIKNNLTISFQESSGQYIDTESFNFSTNVSSKHKYLSSSEDYSIIYTLDYLGTMITKEFIFNKDVYHNVRQRDGKSDNK